jgi:hypothetical protein
MWKVATTDSFDKWYSALDENAKEEVIGKMVLLETIGPKLGRPHADTLNGSKHTNMKELRADTKDKVMRIAFAFDPNRAAILLVAGNKTGVSQKQFYQQLIKKADALYDAHLKNIKEQQRLKGN